MRQPALFSLVLMVTAGCIGGTARPCDSGECEPPTCADGVQNQGEEGIDCGGPCPACGAANSSLKLKALPDILLERSATTTVALEATTEQTAVAFTAVTDTGFASFTITQTGPKTADLAIDAPADDAMIDFEVTADDGASQKKTFFHALVGSIYDVDPSTGVDASHRAGSAAEPWRTIAYAVERLAAAPAPLRLRLAEGVHIIDEPLDLPNHISLVGQGKTATILRGGAGDLYGNTGGWDVERYLIQLDDQYDIATNAHKQVLAGFSIDGADKTLAGGLYIAGQEKVFVNGIEISRTAESCLWVRQSSDGRLANSWFEDCAFRPEGWNMGEIIVYNLDNYLIKNIAIIGRNQSYAIKTLAYTENYGEAFENLQIVESYIQSDPTPSGVWQGIAIELHDGNPVCSRCLISGNYINANLSLVESGAAANLPVGEPDPYPIEISYNYIDVAGTYPIEGGMGGLYVHHNVLRGGAYMSAHWGTEDWSVGFWKYHDNLIVENADAGWPTGLFHRHNAPAGPSTGFFHVLFYQNTVVHEGNNFHCFMAYAADGQHALVGSEDIFVANNIVINLSPDSDMQLVHPQVGAIDGLTIKNNFVRNAVVPARPGVIEDNDLGIDPGFAGIGTEPWERYQLSAQSPLRGAAWDGGRVTLAHPHVGAFGFAATPRTAADATVDWVQ